MVVDGSKMSFGYAEAIHKDKRLRNQTKNTVKVVSHGQDAAFS